MADIDKDVARLIGLYQSAAFEKDVDAFMRLYDPKVRVFDTWGVWVYEGAEAWRRAVEGWFTSLGTERVKVSFDDVQVWTGNGASSVSAIVTYAAVAAPGAAPHRSMQNRITWFIRTAGHVPRIVHEHTSAPLGFEDMKAILVRT
jgi:ketosteroid isomerase-like protein